jgi:hypothetical protein
MFFLPFLPLTTVMVSIFVLTVKPKCYEFDCVDLMQDSLDGDVCWCYEEGGFGCFCCTACHDDSSEVFHAYAK